MVQGSGKLPDLWGNVDSGTRVQDEQGDVYVVHNEHGRVALSLEVGHVLQPGFGTLDEIDHARFRLA